MSFLKDVLSEVRKVSWLKKKEVLSQFFIVHVVAIVIILYFGVIDIAVNTLSGFFG